MKKILIAISCIVLALSMCISLVSCSKDSKPKDKVVDKQSITTQADSDKNSDDKQNAEKVTDKNGNVIAPTDSNGKVIEGNKIETATDEDTTKKDSKKTTAKKNDSDKDKTTTKKKQTTTKKSTTTTTTTIHYTTVNPADPIEAPEIPLEDDYALTGSLAMFNLQEKYDREKYVVNLMEETDDYATLYVFVLKNNDIYSKAKVNLHNGKTTETITKTNKKLTYTL